MLAAVPAASQDLSDVLPELKTLPVPPSVGEGLRLNYLVEVATVPTAFFYEWVNDAGSTNHYNLPSPSGRGRTQVDVIGVTPAYVALRVQPWLYHNFTGPLVPLFGGEEALISHAGGGDWYAHPAALATVEETLQPGLRILRMPLSVAGRLYRALRIQREIRGAQAVVCYDLDTGYLIYKAASVTGKQGVTVSQASFTGSRRISLPWLTGRLPSWTALRPTLRYEGSHTAVAPGPFPYTLPLSAEVAITAATANWFLYEQTTTLGSLPGMPDTVETKTLASGIPSTSPLCLPVPAPDTLRPGDQLDADDVTGAVLTVTHVGTLASGRHGVVLHLRVGDVAWAETAYDGATDAILAHLAEGRDAAAVAGDGRGDRRALVRETRRGRRGGGGGGEAPEVDRGAADDDAGEPEAEAELGVELDVVRHRADAVDADRADRADGDDAEDDGRALGDLRRPGLVDHAGDATDRADGRAPGDADRARDRAGRVAHAPAAHAVDRAAHRARGAGDHRAGDAGLDLIDRGLRARLERERAAGGEVRRELRLRAVEVAVHPERHALRELELGIGRLRVRLGVRGGGRRVLATRVEPVRAGHVGLDRCRDLGGDGDAVALGRRRARAGRDRAEREERARERDARLHDDTFPVARRAASACTLNSSVPPAARYAFRLSAAAVVAPA